MKICLYDENTKLAYNPNTMENAGVSGTQTIVIEVAKELAKRGHEVFVYTKCNFPDIYDGVKYYQHYDYPEDCQDNDVLIGFESFPYLGKYNKNLICINLSTNISPNKIIEYGGSDHIVVLSEWHRDRFASELPKHLMEKVVVIEPGVSKKFFQSDIPKWNQSITYAGHPSKGGMVALMGVAKRLKPKTKDAKIHAYGSGRLWGWDDKQYRPLYDKLIRAKVLYHGQIGKRKMIKHLNHTQIFLYPGTFKETFCLMVLEAMAAGCVVIAGDGDNVKHLVKDTGYIIPGSVKDYKWSMGAVEKILELFESPSLMSEMSGRAIKRAKRYSWEKTVDKLEKLF